MNAKSCNKKKDQIFAGELIRKAVQERWSPRVRGIKRIDIKYLYKTFGLWAYRMNVATEDSPAAETFFLKYDPQKNEIVFSDPPLPEKKKRKKVSA